MYIWILCSAEDEYDIAELTVVGQAFLYHQIRCIMSILCLIGLGKENADVRIICLYFNF